MQIVVLQNSFTELLPSHLHMQAAGIEDLQSELGRMQTTNQIAAGHAGESHSSSKLPVVDEGADLLDIIGAASTK